MKPRNRGLCVYNDILYIRMCIYIYHHPAAIGLPFENG